MSRTFQEGYFRVEVPEELDVEKYDQEGGFHAGYMNKLANTKAVDFILSDGRCLVFLEMKDIRGSRVENKGRDWSTEVGQKVRDTLAGVVGAGRHERDGAWASWAAHVAHPKKPVRVLLFLAADQPMDGRERSTLEDRLCKDLRWLRCAVRVVGPVDLPSQCLGVRAISTGHRDRQA